MHKTGTTSIQKILLNNSEKLKTLGYRAFVNLPQMNAKNNEYFDPAWLRHRVDLAKKDGLQAIIFSAEMISTFNSRQLNSFMEAFIDYDVSFIVCFRHWVSFLPSRWAQNCSRRDTQSFHAYLKNLRNHDRTHVDARFDIVVERLIATNPRNIKIISYDNATTLGRLLPTCLSAFDLPQIFVNSFQGVNLRANITTDIENTELVRLFNGLYSLRNTLESNELFMAISKAIPVKRSYDFSKNIRTILHNHEELKKQLVDIIKENRITVPLSRNDNHITRWEKSVEEISSGFIFNPHNAMLFADVPDVEFVCSEIELDDLPVRIQEKMAVAFRIVDAQNN